MEHNNIATLQKLQPEFKSTCLTAHNELEHIILLTRALVEKECSASIKDRDLIRHRHITQIFEATDARSVKILATIYEQASLISDCAVLASGCKDVLELLNIFYQRTLPTYISKIQNNIDSSAPILRDILIGFASATEILQKNLRQYY